MCPYILHNSLDVYWSRHSAQKPTNVIVDTKKEQIPLLRVAGLFYARFHENKRAKGFFSVCIQVGYNLTVKALIYLVHQHNHYIFFFLLFCAVVSAKQCGHGCIFSPIYFS